MKTLPKLRCAALAAALFLALALGAAAVAIPELSDYKWSVCTKHTDNFFSAAPTASDWNSDSYGATCTTMDMEKEYCGGSPGAADSRFLLYDKWGTGRGCASSTGYALTKYSTTVCVDSATTFAGLSWSVDRRASIYVDSAVAAQYNYDQSSGAPVSLSLSLSTGCHTVAIYLFEWGNTRDVSLQKSLFGFADAPATVLVNSGGAPTGNCVIDGITRTSGSTNPGNACQQCDPSLNAVGWIARTGTPSCTDGLVCSTGTNAVCKAGVCSPAWAPAGNLTEENKLCKPSSGCYAAANSMNIPVSIGQVGSGCFEGMCVSARLEQNSVSGAATAGSHFAAYPSADAGSVYAFYTFYPLDNGGNYVKISSSSAALSLVEVIGDARWVKNGNDLFVYAENRKMSFIVKVQAASTPATGLTLELRYPEASTPFSSYVDIATAPAAQPCPNPCCSNLPGYADKACADSNYYCSGSACLLKQEGSPPIVGCPYVVRPNAARTGLEVTIPSNMLSFYVNSRPADSTCLNFSPAGYPCVWSFLSDYGSQDCFGYDQASSSLSFDLARSNCNVKPGFIPKDPATGLITSGKMKFLCPSLSSQETYLTLNVFNSSLAVSQPKCAISPQIVCLPGNEGCEINSTAGRGPFSANLSIQFQNLPSGTLSAAVKCNSTDAGAAVGISSAGGAWRLCGASSYPLVTQNESIVTVSAQAGGVASCSAQIIDYAGGVGVTVVSVSPSPSASLEVGGTQKFTASATLSNSNVLDVTNTASWASSNPAVGRIDSTGLLTALAVGTTGVTAEYSSVRSSSSTVTVAAAPTPTPKVTPTPTPTGTPSPTATGTPSPTATGTPSPTASVSPTPSPSCTNIITGCTTLNSKGVYCLDANWSVASGPCIQITSSDVWLDCRGHEIAMQGSTPASKAVKVGTGISNASVVNCVLENWNSGIELHNVLNSNFSNNVISGNNGISEPSNDMGVSRLNTFDRNTITYNGSENSGIQLYSFGNTVSNNRVCGTGKWAISVDGGQLGSRSNTCGQGECYEGGTAQKVCVKAGDSGNCDSRC